MKYVIYNESYEPIKIENRTQLLENSVICPEGVRHHSELVIKDMWYDSVNNEEKDNAVEPAPAEINTYKKAVLDPTKVSEYDAVLAAEAAQKAQDDLIQKKKARLTFGMQIKAEVAVINDTKSWDVPTWGTYQSNADIQTLSGLLTDGYIETAMNHLSAADVSAFYTAQEKQDIVDKLQAYLDSE